MPPDSVTARVSGETPHEPARAEREPGRRGRSTTSAHATRTMPWVKLDTAAASARGKRRDVNEDCHSALDGSAAVFVVADGVGGGAMAARASRELVSHLHAALDSRPIDAGAIRNALLIADREVGRTIANHTNASGAATVALAAGSGMTLSRWLVAWVGDCRVYRLGARPHDTADLLTVDDTYRHLREAPPPGGSRDDPARMVGNGAVSAPNVDEVALRSGEMLVLVSDGVHKHVDSQDLSRVLHQRAPLVRRCSRLVALARAHGSSDDATVLVVQREPRRWRLAWLALSVALLVALAITMMVLR